MLSEVELVRSLVILGASYGWNFSKFTHMSSCVRGSIWKRPRAGPSPIWRRCTRSLSCIAVPSNSSSAAVLSKSIAMSVGRITVARNSCGVGITDPSHSYWRHYRDVAPLARPHIIFSPRRTDRASSYSQATTRQNACPTCRSTIDSLSLPGANEPFPRGAKKQLILSTSTEHHERPSLVRSFWRQAYCHYD